MKQNLPYLLIAIFVFVYVVLRAILVPPYYDEITTFFTYVQPGAFQPYYSFLDANNHVLNSFLERLSYLAFGHEIFVLRLPNILSFIIYAIYAWKLARLLKSQLLGICFFITLLSSLYLISFFSLSRGYGLSMAFLAGAIYYLLIFHKNFNYKNLLAGLIMSILALWANLSLMQLILIIGGIFTVLVLINFYNSKNYSKLLLQAGIIIIVYALPVLYAVKYAFALKEGGALFHGSSQNFMKALVTHVPAEFADSIIIGNSIFFSLLVIYFAAIFISVKKQRKATVFIPHLLFWGTLLGTIALHVALGVNYPTERAAIHFFLLFAVVFFFTIDAVEINLFKYSSLILTVPLVAQFIITFNFQYARSWRHETVPVSFYNTFKDSYERTGVLPTVSAHGLLGEVIHFYGFENGGDYYTQRKEIPGSTADFLITNIMNRFDTIRNYDTLEFNVKTGVALWKRKTPFIWKNISALPANNYSGDAEFINFCSAPADSFINKPFCFDMNMNVQSDDDIFYGWFICAVSDSLGENLGYYDMFMQRMKPHFRETQHVHRRQYIENIPANAKSISFYIWNLKKQKINISDVKVQLMRGAE